jgi:hypothetical protein
MAMEHLVGLHPPFARGLSRPMGEMLRAISLAARNLRFNFRVPFWSGGTKMRKVLPGFGLPSEDALCLLASIWL